MAIKDNRIEDIRKAIHKEVDELLDTPYLTSFRITFEAGLTEALKATVKKDVFLKTDHGVCTMPFVDKKELEDNGENQSASDEIRPIQETFDMALRKGLEEGGNK